MFSVREKDKKNWENQRSNDDFINLQTKIRIMCLIKKSWVIFVLADYEINYKPILKQNNEHKLLKLEKF